MNSKGTPKNIPEFVRSELSVGPLATLESRLIYGFRDLLAQRFNVALLKVDDRDPNIMILDLWKSIIEGIEAPKSEEKKP